MTEVQDTIIVLSHNAKNITQKFIELLFANTDNFNLIMIDNGSTDGTVEYLTDTLNSIANLNDNQKNVTLVCNEENLGVIGGRNMGFALYQNQITDYLCFLDNDQFVRKGWLEQYHQFMNNNRFDVVGADAWLMDSAYMPRRNCKKQGEPFTYVGCGGMMMRRSVFEKVGSFDEQFNPAYFEDPDYNFRVRQNGFRIGWNYLAKVDHLPHQTLGKQHDRMNIFATSYAKFKMKWNGTQFQPLR